MKKRGIIKLLGTISFFALVAVSIFLLKQTGLFKKSAYALTNCDVSSSLLGETSADSTLLGLINTYRQQNGLSALSWSAGLNQAASWQSNDMSTHNTFSHTDSLGRTPNVRIPACGYNWTSFAENIFMGSDDPQAVFTAWRNSPEHNANMLNSSVTQAGISDVNAHWTLDEGTGSSTVVGPTMTVIPTQALSPSPDVTSNPSPSSTPSPTPTPQINLNPTDTQIDVSIKLPGIGETGNKNPVHLTRPVFISVFDTTNKEVLTGNGFLKYDGKNLFEGIIHLGQLADGTYLIKVQSTNTLVTYVFPQFQQLTSSKVNVLPFVILIPGDFNNDNVIDINDYNLALPCFQNANCKGGANVDINDDGRKDVIDYNLFLSDFRRYQGD